MFYDLVREKLYADNMRLREVLQIIANKKPTLDTLPLDQAFRTLREITSMAKNAIDPYQ